MFDVFTPLAGGQLDATAFQRGPVMFQNHGDLNYTRLPSHQAWHPYPYTIGFVQGFLPLMNETEYALMIGKTPYGPYMGNALPNFSQVFPNIQGGLSKVTG